MQSLQPNGSLKEIVEKILAMDISVFLVSISNRRGDILIHTFNQSASDELKQTMKNVMREKGFVPALTTGVFEEDAKYLGDVDYVVVSFGKMKGMFIPMRSRGLVIALTLSTNTDSRSIAIQVRNFLPE